MHEPYKVKCLDAIYDEDNGFMVLNLLFLNMNERRIVAWHKDDFLFKGRPGVPDSEMIHTARMIKDREFNLVIKDDPDRQVLTESEQAHYGTLFNKRLVDELGKVTEGLADDEGQIARKLYQMGKEGKLDVAKMYEKELHTRNKLGLS